MRDNSRILTWVFIFVALISAAVVVVAAWISANGNKPLPTAPLLTPTQPITQASSLLLPTPQGELIFDENFNDGIANGMQVTGAMTNTKWEIIDNTSSGKLFQMENTGADWVGFTLGTTSIANGTIEYKVKLVNYDPSLGNGSGAIACHFRSNSQDRYLFALQADANAISINFQGVDTNNQWATLNNAVSPYDFKKDVWYEVIIDLNGNEITVYLDSKKVLTAKDDKLKTGEILFAMAPNTIAQFDDLRVWSQP